MLIDLTSGTEITQQDMDALSIQFIPFDVLADEALLFQTKHWDYRFMHPVEATQRYTQAYKAAYKRATARRLDVYIGRNVKGVKKDQFWELTASEITSLWKGRQMADRMGCDYDFYCEHVMQFASKALYARLPRPQGCYAHKSPASVEGMPTMIEFIGMSWAERSKTQTIYATHEGYQIANYCGGHEQNLYLNYLVQRVRHSNLPEGALASAIEKGLINREMVMRVMPQSGAGLYARAERLLA